MEIAEDRARKRYAKLLRDDIELITKKLPDALTGNKQVCVSVYQPALEGYRLVFIDKEIAPSDPIWLEPGIAAHQPLRDRNLPAKYEDWARAVTPELLEYYVNTNEIGMRLRLLERYRLRFQESVTFDKDQGHVVAGTFCRLRYICPASDWEHVPRLGTLYTFSDNYGTGPRLHHDTVEAARLIFAARLFTLLGSRHPLFDNSALDIAKKLAGKGVVADDDLLYLVVKCMFVHHFFYPQGEVAKVLLKKASGESYSKVWSRHGWPAFADIEIQEYEFDAVVDAFSHDIAFLALASQGNTEISKLDSDLLTERIRRQCLKAVAILCGDVCRVAIFDEKVLVLNKKTEADYRPAERWLMIRPPQGMKFTEQTLVPAFAEMKVKDWLKENDGSTKSDSIIHDLSSSVDQVAFTNQRNTYRTYCDHIDLADDRQHVHITDKDDPRLREWLVRYARARCHLTFAKWEEERKTPKVSTAQQQSNPSQTE